MCFFCKNFTTGIFFAALNSQCTNISRQHVSDTRYIFLELKHFQLCTLWLNSLICVLSHLCKFSSCLVWTHLYRRNSTSFPPSTFYKLINKFVNHHRWEKTALRPHRILELNDSMKIFTLNSQPPLKWNVSAYSLFFADEERKKKTVWVTFLEVCTLSISPPYSSCNHSVSRLMDWQSILYFTLKVHWVLFIILALIL